MGNVQHGMTLSAMKLRLLVNLYAPKWGQGICDLFLNSNYQPQRKGFEMNYKSLLLSMLHLGSRLESGNAKRTSTSKRPPGIDLMAIKASASMPEADRRARYRSGRFAEMTEEQAGL
jgi:hypothetical protein